MKRTKTSARLINSSHPLVKISWFPGMVIRITAQWSNDLLQKPEIHRELVAYYNSQAPLPSTFPHHIFSNPNLSNWHPMSNRQTRLLQPANSTPERTPSPPTSPYSALPPVVERFQSTRELLAQVIRANRKPPSPNPFTPTTFQVEPTTLPDINALLQTAFSVDFCLIPSVTQSAFSPPSIFRRTHTQPSLSPSRNPVHHSLRTTRRSTRTSTHHLSLDLIQSLNHSQSQTLPLTPSLPPLSLPQPPLPPTTLQPTPVHLPRIFPPRIIPAEQQSQEVTQNLWEETATSRALPLFSNNSTFNISTPGSEWEDQLDWQPRLNLTMMMDTLLMAIQQEERANRTLQNMTQNEFNLRPRHQEPVLVQVARATNTVAFQYRAIPVTQPTGSALLHNIRLEPKIRGILARITPIPLQNVRGGRVKKSDGSDWVQIIDSRAMKFLFWNLRGGVRPESMQAVGNYITEYRPVMILLMDTRANSEHTTRNIAGLMNMGYPNVHIGTPPADHPQMGGQWCLWNENQIKVEVKRTNDRLAHFEIKIVEAQQTMAALTSVYNYPQPNKQDEAGCSNTTPTTHP